MSENIIDKINRLNLADYYDDWMKSNSIIGATFEITSNCNFNCVHCYMGELRHSSNQLSYEQIIKIIDILYDNGVLFLTFSGGEPFCRKDFKDIYVYAKKKGFIVDIFSNGTLIDEEWIKILDEYPPLLIDFSIYGATNQTYKKITGKEGMFDKFIYTLQLLKKSNIRFSIKTPLLSLNYKELYMMREISTRYSNESFRFSYDIVPNRNNNLAPQDYELDPLQAVLLEIEEGSNIVALTQTGEEKNNWQEAKEKSKFVPAYFCSIGKFSVHIDFLGNISPCIECESKYNIFDYDFNYICEQFLKYKKISAKDNYECVKCKALMFCSSCPQIRKRLYGDEQCITARDCIVAKLKYKYYVDKFSIDELKRYYLEFLKEVKQ